MQCEVLGLSRTAYYYQPKGESEGNLQLMNEIDKEHLEHPATGVVRMTDYLRGLGYSVGCRKVRRLMRKVGVKPVYRTRSLSKLGQPVYVKQYLLRGLKVDRPNQVWCIDITYIPMKKGFLYLTAIIDVYSRFVVAWNLSNTLDASNCIEALEQGVLRYGAPEIINSDQGCQFTSKEWSDACAKYPSMKVSMDGRGRAKDNIWIERFWKTIKYEYIYIQMEESGSDLFNGIKRFIEYYNHRRQHQGVGHQVPYRLYLQNKACA